MDYDDLINKAGTEERLALFLNAHIYTIQRWRKYGIPTKYWEALIKKYDVSPAELFSINEKAKKDRRARASK